jgi:hypothetical protein
MERAVTFCQGVRGLVRFGTEIPPVPESFVESLRNEIRERSAVDEETLAVSPVIQIGDEAEIAHGPLQGMRGTIVAIAPAAERVKILLEFPRPDPCGGRGLFSSSFQDARSLKAGRRSPHIHPVTFPALVSFPNGKSDHGRQRLWNKC